MKAAIENAIPEIDTTSRSHRLRRRPTGGNRQRSEKQQAAGKPSGSTSVWVRLAVIALTALVTAGNGAAIADEGDMPSWLRERLGGRFSNRRDNDEMMRLLGSVTEPVGESLVEVLSGGQLVALGTVVTEDGKVLTKRSELSGDPIRIRLADDRLLPARVAAVRRRSDLALLAISGGDATFDPVTWDAETPPVGSFLVTPGHGGRPTGLGVVGVRARPVEHHGRLGVVLQKYADGGALVQGIWPDSGADRAGVELGDRIVAINGHKQPNRSSVISTLKDMFPGEVVRLTIDRGGSMLEMDARMRELRVMQESKNDTMVNGPRSRRLSGFEQVIQHDTVLDPDQCGGPVLDTSGHVVGLNIARAGRVVSYALPASLVTSELDSMLTETRRQEEVAAR